jgi:hypothetical protein
MYAELTLKNSAIKDLLSENSSPAAKLAAVDVMVTEHRLSRVKACKLAGVSRAGLYRERADWAKRDTPVVEALSEVVEHHGRWGFWKCFHRLRDQGHVGTDHGIKLRFIQPGKPNQYAFVERFSKSVRTEELNAWLIHSLEQAQEVIED